MMRKWITGVAVGLALLALGGATALAVLPWESETGSIKTKGATTVTWDSSFQDLDYALGDTMTMTVDWTVLAGAATYQKFEFKRATPKAAKDPAVCTIGSTSQSGNSVDVQFTFSQLHLDQKRNVEIGNCHFKLFLNIDKSGDGVLDSVAGYGVNVHVEDPQ